MQETTSCLTVDDRVIERVDQFLYLGCTNVKHRRTDEDLSGRIRKAKVNFAQLVAMRKPSQIINVHYHTHPTIRIAVGVAN